MPRRTLPQLLRAEFTGYSAGALRADLLAGITVAAVALPLALAFGVASGASAAAGLVTAILSGLIIGGLSGAPYQISGPTGAMSAVLIVLAQRYGLSGVWVAGLLSGLLLAAIGLLRLGRFIAFIPAPVITGFTSGIALIIAIGQIDNWLGVKTPAADSAALKLLGYLQHPVLPDGHTLALGGLVMAVMLAWPKDWNRRFPGSLLGLMAAALAAAGAGWTVPVIGAIPQTLLLADRLHLEAIPWTSLQDFIGPTLTITALGAVESLLCGAVASNMTGVRLQANQELVAQGVGNVVIPFFGGVPATAAIARTSVGIKSGGRTRLVSVVHSLVLLASMFILAPVMSRIPLAALAGVLIVTAWRMNEWEAIRFIFGRRFKTGMATFLITMLATVTLDLTQAILIGAFLSGAVFLNQVANLDIDLQAVDNERLREHGLPDDPSRPNISVAHLTGPLFFAASGQFNEAFAHLNPGQVLILSMRGVPLLDVTGVQVIRHVHERLVSLGGGLLLAGVHDKVRHTLERGGLVESIGAENFFSTTDQAVIAAAQLTNVRPE